MFNFIESLVEFTAETESPEAFWRWAALACLNGVLRDNVSLETLVGTVYPNLYVILLSDSGIARKAAPCKFAGKLIQKVGNTKFIAGRASMQAVVKELGRSYTNDVGHVINGAAGVLYSEELSSFIVDDLATIPLLIDLYDYHEKWSTNLISWDGNLKNVCLSLIAASNSDLLSSVYTDKAIKGGLLGRTFIIREEKARHRRSLFELKPHGEADWNKIIEHLVRISKLKGALKIERNAETEYNTWYHSIPDEVFIDKVGFGSRLGTHVVKVAIGLAAAREDFDKYLTLPDIMQAIDMCQSLRRTYKEFAFGAGAATNSYLASLIVRAMLQEPRYHITRTKLIQRTFGDITDVSVLDNLLIYMVQGGLVEEISLSNQVAYRLSKEGLAFLMRGDKDAK